MDDQELVILFTSESDKNPYHELLFDALSEHGVNPIQESLPLFLPLTRTVHRVDRVDVIHLDWLYSLFHVNKVTDSTAINTVLTACMAFMLCVDLLCIKLLSVPLVWTVHNKYDHNRDYYTVEKALNVVVANVVDAISVKCESAGETVEEIYRIRDGSKVVIVPDGNYKNAYPNKLKKPVAREELGIGNEFVYLYFGMIQPYKGVKELIDQFRNIDAPDASLWIVGMPNTERLANRITERAAEDDRIHTRLEFVPAEEVQYYFNAADILVFPYRSILNSGSVLLGLSFGRPIVAPEIGCIPSVVPTENELLYDPEDPDGLEDALVEARSVDIEKIGSANFQYADSLRWSKAGLAYKNVYLQIVASES